MAKRYCRIVVDGTTFRSTGLLYGSGKKAGFEGFNFSDEPTPEFMTELYGNDEGLFFGKTLAEIGNIQFIIIRNHPNSEWKTIERCSHFIKVLPWDWIQLDVYPQNYIMHRADYGFRHLGDIKPHLPNTPCVNDLYQSVINEMPTPYITRVGINDGLVPDFSHWSLRGAGLTMEYGAP